MSSDLFLHGFFIIFVGAAILSTIALYTRQSLLVAYIVLGAIIGPWGLNLVTNVHLPQQVGDIGILFLLFLLGLHLHPQNLMQMLRKISWVALVSSFVFALMGYGVGVLFGFSHIDSVIIGASMMFSSTIIGLKLLPTTILHHQHTGEVMISVLLMQDVIAILVLILIHDSGGGGLELHEILLSCINFPFLLLVAYLGERFVLIKLLARFDKIKEYVFLLSIAWCIGMAQLGEHIGLSSDIGAFVAGVTLALNPIADYIAESLKPLRDFFLVMFFFAVGASFDFSYLNVIILPALLLAALIMLVKPFLFKVLLQKVGEPSSLALEVGVRLAQGSEFSLLLGALALSTSLLSVKGANLIQATTILTFIASSYIVVLKYTTPMALTEKMQKD